MLDQGCGFEASPSQVRRQFSADTHANKLKGKYGAITNKCIFVGKVIWNAN
jgi:hypothetical protein